MKFLRNGMGTVNCGDLREIDGLEVEVLCPATSGHADNIVCTYFSENGRKVELTYFVDGSHDGHEVYRFRRPTDAQHYWSRLYRCNTLPKHYAQLAERLKAIHAKVFAA